MKEKERRQLNMNTPEMIRARPLQRLAEPEELDDMEDALYEKRLEAICWMRSKGISLLSEVAKEDGRPDDGG